MFSEFLDSLNKENERNFKNRLTIFELKKELDSNPFFSLPQNLDNDWLDKLCDCSFSEEYKNIREEAQLENDSIFVLSLLGLLSAKLQRGVSENELINFVDEYRIELILEKEYREGKIQDFEKADIDDIFSEERRIYISMKGGSNE